MNIYKKIFLIIRTVPAKVALVSVGTMFFVP